MIKPKLLLLIISLWCGLYQIYGQTTIMTFNIRYDNHNDGLDRWDLRKEALTLMLKSYSPSILGVQEALKTQMDFLDGELHSYKYVGVGRDDGIEKGEFSAIFYDTTQFKLIETQTYWLSQTPDIVSVGWDASMERIVTYGVFKNVSTDDTLFVFNTHYDHIGKEARKGSSELILRLIDKKSLKSKPLVVMGDLNSEVQDAPIQLLKQYLEDSFENAENPVQGPVGTFNGFDPKLIPHRRIDYIFTQNLVVQTYQTIDERRNNHRCISDHLPVLIKVSDPKNK